jgi:crotonobetainyl-CoA:carnitine CoA-transferase CaiB-like acyl-CoA transferase
VLPYTRTNFEDIFRAGGREDLADDERIRSTRARLDHADDLYREVATIIAQRTTAEWLEFCLASDVPASPVPTLEELVDALPEDVHPVAGRYKVIPQPVRFSRMPGPTVRRPAALSGQHTDEVMTEVRSVRAAGGSGPIDGVDEEPGGGR